MDKPVTPAEELRDALSSLVLSLDKLREVLEVLASQIIQSPDPPSGAATAGS
jgi:hypothetical protein